MVVFFFLVFFLSLSLLFLWSSSHASLNGWRKLCFPVLIVSRSSVHCFSKSKFNYLDVHYRYNRGWNVGQDFDLGWRVFRHIHWLYLCLFIHGVYVCRIDCFHLFLWLECIALTGNGFCLLHGCISLKSNEQAWSTRFEILSATGKGLTSRYNWK